MYNVQWLYIHTHHTQPMYMKLWDQTKLTKKENKFVICHLVCQLQTQYFQMSHIQFSSISGASCHMNHVLTNILRLPISSTKIYTTQKCKSKSCTQSKRPGWHSRVVDKGKQSGKKSSQCPTSHQWCPKWHPRVRNSCHWRCTQRLQCKCGRKQRFPQIWPWTVSLTTQNSTFAPGKGNKLNKAFHYPTKIFTWRLHGLGFCLWQIQRRVSFRLGKEASLLRTPDPAQINLEMQTYTNEMWTYGWKSALSKTGRVLSTSLWRVTQLCQSVGW